ncbi:MAG: nitrate reductase molybdenum cofactor assembly chaperone [Alcaligenaceae bacterium]
MKIFKLLSALLCYPEPPLLAALNDIEKHCAIETSHAQVLKPLLDYLNSAALIRLQENYVATFDRSTSHSLHLFEHIHGESRDRGQAMVDLLEEYRKHGFELSTSELPDYVPLFLEFLAQLPHDQAQVLLGDAIHVLAMIGNKLAADKSPYACVFALIRMHCSTEPIAFTEPPVRDMDEALETFGAGADGVEPLLRPNMTHTMQFHPKPTQAPEQGHRPSQTCS